LDQLHQKLAAATVLFEQHADGGRAGAYRALQEIVDYFSDLGIPYATLLPFSALAAALVDADRGVESRLFKPDRKGGRPPKAALLDLMDQQFAVVMECCVWHLRDKAGKRTYLDEAARLAAKLVNESRLNCTVTAVQMREVRERIRQLRVGDAGRMQYDLLLDSPVAQADPLRWASTLMDHDWVSSPNLSG